MKATPERAVTMVELLMVIAIITVISGILFPVFMRVRAKGRQTACLSNLHQIGTAELTYAQDYEGYFPPYYNYLPEFLPQEEPWRCDPLALHDALQPYVRSSDDQIGVWFCPADPVAGMGTIEGTAYHRYSSYGYHPSFQKYGQASVDGMNMPDWVKTPSEAPLVWDSIAASHFEGGNTVYVDGHTRWQHALSSGN